MLVYDCEIIKAIPGRNRPRLDGVEYCDGWDDFENMGISVICAYDVLEMESHVYLADNFESFVELARKRGGVAGFNNHKFDDRLIAANGLDLGDDVRSLDLLVNIWAAHGLGPEFNYRTHMGFSLDNCAAANELGSKTGNGAMAPVLWQQGKCGEVIDYCLHDVVLTTSLIKLVMREEFVSPQSYRKIDVEWAWDFFAR